MARTHTHTHTKDVSVDVSTAPGDVGSDAEVAGDRIERLAVADRLVPAVKRQQREPEALELADEIAQRACE